MDIITHTLTGLTAGTLVASYTKGSLGRKIRIAMVGALGGAFPDVDAISMWSKFDSTIGALFHLQHTGREIYSAKLWYSHHAFFHSLLASLIVALLLGLVVYLFRSLRQGVSPSNFMRMNIPYLKAFVFGCWTHLLGDMPTPAAAWGGVNLFWPYHGYVGGTGQIWWWNNYDIFLLVLATACFNLTILLLANYRSLKAPQYTMAATAIVVVLILVQVNTRKVDYNKGGYAKLEEQSKQEQRRLLGDKLYDTMVWLDKRLRLNF